MARTTVTKYQVLDRQLTGSDINNLVGIYDETQNYSEGAYVFWNATKYRCKLAVTGTEEGNLTNAPHVDTTHWEEITFTGISVSEHRLLDQLVHDIAENSYCEITRVTGKVSTIIIWTDSGKTIKIRECSVARDGNGKVTSTTIKQYNGTGTLVETYTQTITRAGGKVTSIDGVLT